MLRLENLDTDLRPCWRRPCGAHRRPSRTTRPIAGCQPSGKSDLKQAGWLTSWRSDQGFHDPGTQIVITRGEGDAMVDALFATTDPGDEVILTDPTYAG